MNRLSATLLRKLALLVCLLLPLTAPAFASETLAEHTANVAAQHELDSSPVHGNIPSYALAPGDLAKAQALWPIRAITQIVAVLWSVLTCVILLWGGIAAWIRDRALAASAELRAAGKNGRAFFRELIVFAPLYTGITALFALPITLYRHVIAIRYGLSVQGWASWSRDYLIGFIGLLLTACFFFAVIRFFLRRAPRLWWLICWAIVVPVTLLFVFATPYVIDPLFNKFEPLQPANPALVERLEQVVAKGHMDIPPERMFLMRASSKVTTMNAYVTGFGASKRVVVWDTSLQKGTPDEVLFIFGHESGHYVLGHIREGMALGLVALLAGLFLASRFLPWAIARFGARWRIPAQGDWAALVVLALFLALVNVVADPVSSAIIRTREHAADVYGQEAIHGIVADPQHTAQHAFEVLAASSFEEPNMPQWYTFLFYNHPATGRRAAFAAHYDPWGPGVQPKYLREGQK